MSARSSSMAGSPDPTTVGGRPGSAPAPRLLGLAGRAAPAALAQVRRGAEEHDRHPGQHDPGPHHRAEHHAGGPVDDRAADLGEHLERAGEERGGREQRQPGARAGPRPRRGCGRRTRSRPRRWPSAPSVSAAQVTSSTPPTLAHPSQRAPAGCEELDCQDGRRVEIDPRPRVPRRRRCRRPRGDGSPRGVRRRRRGRTSTRSAALQGVRLLVPVVAIARRGGGRRARAGPRQDQRHGGGAADPARRPARDCSPSPGRRRWRRGTPRPGRSRSPRHRRPGGAAGAGRRPGRRRGRPGPRSRSRARTCRRWRPAGSSPAWASAFGYWAWIRPATE